MSILPNFRKLIWDATTAIVGDTIALWSPQGANAYRRNRELYWRAYTATNAKGPYQSHNPSNKSGLSEVMAARLKVQARVRDVCRNNPFVASLELKRATAVIGDEIGCKWQIKDDKNKPATALNKELERRFYSWADTAGADGSSLTECAHFIENHLLEDGEVISKDAMVGSGLTNPYRVQILETDYLDTSKDTYGIQYDKYGKPLAFHLYDKHPYGNEGAGSSSPTKAEDIVFLAETTRSSQRRGISQLTPALQKLYGVDDLENAELVAARSGCMYGVVIMSDLAAGEEPPDADDTATHDDAGRDREYVDSGGILRLQPGEKVESFKSERPNSNFEGFTRGRQRTGAGSAGMSYETSTGDFSQVNFSSAKMSKNVEWANLRRRQARIRRWLRHVVAVWLRAEIALGLPGLTAQAFNAAPWKYLAVTFQLAGNDGIEPLKEIQTLEAEIALGVNSRTRYCAERGRDQPEIAEELQAEKADLEARGLYQEDPVAPKVVTESSSTSTATSTSTTTPAGDEPPAPDKEADNADQ